MGRVGCSLPTRPFLLVTSRTLSHEPENLHDNSQRDLWTSSAAPRVTNFLRLAGRNRRLDGADVVKLDRSLRRRRLELLRNKPRHAWLTQRKQTRIAQKQALIGGIRMSAACQTPCLLTPRSGHLRVRSPCLTKNPVQCTDVPREKSFFGYDPGLHRDCKIEIAGVTPNQKRTRDNRLPKKSV